MDKDILDDMLGDIIDTKPIMTKPIDKPITTKEKEIKMENIEIKMEAKEVKSEVIKIEDNKFLPGVSVDVGTSFICSTRYTEDGKFINKFHRNSLYALDINEESADLLERSNYLYIKTENKYYVIGNDAISLVNALGKGEIIRPMKNGLLNESIRESENLLFNVIKCVVGNPIVPRENLRYTVPASPIDKDVNNLFHQNVLNNLFEKMGYAAKPVNEAMCVIFNCNPIMKSEDGDVPFTGIGISFGAGMANVVLTYKGMSLVEFSCTKSGDNIDEQVEKVTGMSKGKIIKIKEKKLNLNKIDDNDRVQSALSVYYDETIDRIVKNIENKFKNVGSEIDGEIEIVVSGGTAKVPGFDKRLEASIRNSSIPFKIYRVRMADDIFFAVSNGANVRAQSDYKKSLK